ncbi:hypothetical protein [Psychrobacillus sp. FSL K6-1464]|uniref:hypothetical protein n=1 Tax=Psychrobacillus sp. FSL K6-1464 TaxID=2921545 RepID=UPI0030FC35BD
MSKTINYSPEVRAIFTEQENDGFKIELLNTAREIQYLGLLMENALSLPGFYDQKALDGKLILATISKQNRPIVCLEFEEFNGTLAIIQAKTKQNKLLYKDNEHEDALNFLTRFLLLNNIKIGTGDIGIV